ncbi:putative protein kinase [Trypanosoma rangeli]|uniref:Protein kinase domain-containing protein n=1 Tax=Trypanosoma rangeli TaxID=5698 RepID=A0A3R7N3K6_TRYRA|nr:putative protein kinase [Trypanosoma rangeli]RNF12288.1 putative protein kinase [Trypanosoma rangeli]|eukprot:RNF12288.1 putative protein kinase [Trypanosoma rangeli]
MKRDTSQPAVKFLLLLLLDGRLCCVSVANGKLRWEAQLPGGPLFHCGPRCQGKREKRMWAQLPSRFACRNCRSMAISASGMEAQPEETLGDNVKDCSLVFIPSGDTKHAFSLMKWHFFIPSNCSDRKDVWLPAREVLECWNASACSGHRALDLQQQVTTHTELDFFSGKLLISLTAEAEDIDNEEETVLNEFSCVRVVLQRTDHTQSMIFPPFQALSRSTVDSSGEEEVSRSWYATTSTVMLDVIDLSLDTVSLKSWFHAEKQSFHIEQTVAMNRFTSCLCISGESGDVGKVQLTDLRSPIVSAQIIFWEPHTVASNGGSTSKLRCQDVPVATSWERMEATPGHSWNLQRRGGHVQEISGFLDDNGRVLFADYIARKNELASVYAETQVSETQGEDYLSSRCSVSPGTENGHFFGDYDDSSETDSSTASGFSENAMVLHNNSTFFHKSTETGALFHTGNQISFFDENFEVITMLGRGASGAVLLTRQRLTGIFYAIKVMLMRDYSSKDNVLREVRLHAILHNRYLARYYAGWSEALTPYRVQQLESIGVCKSRSIQDKYVINGSGCIGWLDHQQGGPLSLNSSENRLLPPGTHVMNRNLMAPPEVMHEDCNGMYLAGGDSLDSVCEYCEGEDDSDSSFHERTSSFSSTPGNVLTRRVVFLQMEYCQTTLAHRLGSRSVIDRVENIIIALQIFSALRYVHRRDCLHRDVKPTNVFLDYNCQTIGLNDTSDDDSDGNAVEEEEEEDDDAAANAVPPNTEVHSANTFGDDDADTTLKLQQSDLSPALPVQVLSAFELLRLNASVGLLALYLKRFKCAQGEAEKRKVIRLVRKWLKCRLVQVRLGDFGLAKPLGDQHVEAAHYFDRSAINTVGVGSPLYSSPEQLEGAICTPAADAFSAGVLLAELYIQPKTVSERLVELQRVREGVFPCSSLLLDYPELQVVQGLTRKNPSARMTLRDATRLLVITLDKMIFTFISS